MSEMTKTISENLKDRVHKLDQAIAQNQKKMLMYEMVKGEKRYREIFLMQTAIEGCLQCGNYRRALHYILMAEKRLAEFKKQLPALEKQLTEYFTYKKVTKGKK